MKVCVLGGGIMGVATAWYLLDEGHEVTVIDRQPAAALETSFANGSQISVSYCEPWASKTAPLKVAKWMFSANSPLLFRPRLDPQQWRWALAFLGQCSDAAFERNVKQLVALGRYSQASLQDLVARTGVAYHRLERGILHYFTSQQALDDGAAGAALMARYGVQRQVLSRDDVLAVEPALRSFGPRITGGTYTASDESGDARVFTQQLADACAARGAQFLWGHAVERVEVAGGEATGVVVRKLNNSAPSATAVPIKADAVVCALGPYTAPFLRANPGTRTIQLNIYPAKGYSATLRLKQPDRANLVSLIDDEFKIAFSRLGEQLRIAGTAEITGYDTSLHSPTSQLRCQQLLRRCEQVFPGVADTTEPNFWAGLRPSTPNNIPYIGTTQVRGLFINAGHGTLGWTHGAGSGRAMALLVSGKRPELDFVFRGEDGC